MEDSDIVALVDEIVGCALSTNPSKNLKLILLHNTKEPNFTTLRQAMDTCITRALEKQRNEYFKFAALLGQWITVISALELEPFWMQILSKDNDSILIENEYSKWCWERFFDWELRHSLNANQCHEQMKILYDAKRISLFQAKHYSKVLFRLLKLGAAPFELKQSKDNTHTKTLTYSIISSNKLTRMKRIHLLNHLLKRNLLRLDPSGRQGISPLQLCLTDQRKRHALKILLKVSSFDKVQLKGDNILLECNISNRYYEHILSFLTVEQIKQLLKQPNDSFLALSSMRQPVRYPYFENIFTAMKELAQEFPHTIDKLSQILSEHVFVQHVGQHAIEYVDQKAVQQLQKFRDAIKSYWKNSQPRSRSRSDLKFNGNTEFPFEHLPIELSEIICSYLPMQDRMQLLSTNKSMRSLQDAFGEYYWKTALKLSFPVVYSQQIENKCENRSWHDRTLSVFRTAENWKQGKFTKKFIRYDGSIQTPYGLHFDEHWLCAGRGSNMMFWNCTNGSEEFEHYLKLPSTPWDIKYLSSTPSALPNIVFSDTEKFGYYINYNNNFKTFKLAEHFPRPKMPNPDRDPHQITVLTENTFIVRFGIFDIELGKAVTKFPEYNIRTSKKLLFSDNIIGATYNTLDIFDKDLRRVAKSGPFSKTVEGLTSTLLTVLDEYLVYYSATGYPFDNNHHSVVDIRTMKKVNDGLQHVYSVNSACRTLSIEKGVCIVRNVKNSTWETTFPLPNEATDLYSMNSKYLVFGSHAAPKNSNMVVLDFDPIVQ